MKKVSPHLRDLYRELKAELQTLESGEKIEYVRNQIRERIIFKELPQVCVKCGVTQQLTLDHIVPQHILNDLNVTEVIDDNYQVLCKYCNQKKGGRLDIREPHAVETLKRIVNKL